MTTAKRDTYTPETLLSVAVQVFIERGYDGTSMEHLSKAAGISKSSIYHHVTGKEELLRRAVSRALDELFGILDEEQARVGSAAERLEYVVRRMVEVLMAELPYVTLLLRVRGNTGTERWALERRREFDHRVADLLRAAAAEGDVRADVEVRLATRLVFGMINSIVEWYRPDGPDGRGGSGGAGEREVVDAVARLVFGGCARRPEAATRPWPRRSALWLQVLGLEHQQGAGAEHLRDGLEAGEHQLAQGPVVGGVHQEQDVEVAPHQGDVGGAGELPQLGADRAPGVLNDLQGDVRRGAVPRPLVVDAGAEAADDAVLDEAVDAGVGVGARDVDPLGDRPYRGAAVRLEHAQDVLVDGVQRARGRGGRVLGGAVAVRAFGHLFSCHVPPPSHDGRTASISGCGEPFVHSLGSRVAKMCRRPNNR